jgi:hypothetical protein
MLTEDEGVKAIQYLLSINNQSEPEEISRKNWNSFSDNEKEQTEAAYNIFKAKDN